MAKLAVLLIGLLALLGFAAAKEDLAPEDSLRIGVKHKPEVCEVKAANGDRLKVRLPTQRSLWMEAGQY
jgi:hypothetical protein